MSQFSLPTESLRRFRREEPGGIGLGGAIEAPGLVPEPPVSASETQLFQLGEALGVLGSAAGAVSGLAARRIAEREELERDRERRRADALRNAQIRANNAEFIDNVTRGEFRRAARESLPTILDDIAQRKIVIPNGETPQSMMEGLLEERFGDDEVGLLAAREQIGPAVINALTDQMTAERERARGENLRAIADEMGAGDGDPAALVAQARRAHPELSDSEAFDAIVLPAASAAADRGDVDRVNAIVNAAGAGFETRRQALVDHAEAVRVRDEGIAQTANRETISGLILDGNLETAHQRIEEFRADGRISQEDATVLRNRVVAEVNRQKTGADARLKRQLIDQWTDTQVSGWASSLLSAETSGGRLALPREDVTLEGPDGEIIARISPKEAFDLALTDAMGQLERRITDPEQLIPQQAALLAANAAEWEPWKQVLAQGAAFMPIAVRRIQDGGEAPPLPASAVAGFELYKQLNDLSPELLDAHIPNAGHRLLYEMAELAEESDARLRVETRGGEVSAPNPNAALVRAVSAIASGASGSIDRDRLAKTLDDNATIGNWRDGSAWAIWWTEGKIDNYEDIRGAVAAKAEYFLRTGATANYGDAVKAAVKSVKRSHTRLNGYLVETSTSLNKRTLANVTEHLSGRYAEQFGEEEGVKAGDITLVPVRGRPGLWQLLRKDGSLLSPLNNSFSFLESNLITDRQILDIAAGAAARGGQTTRQAGLEFVREQTRTLGQLPPPPGFDFNAALPRQNQ